jgi:hypothetical protein
MDVLNDVNKGRFERTQVSENVEFKGKKGKLIVQDSSQRKNHSSIHSARICRSFICSCDSI